MFWHEVHVLMGSIVFMIAEDMLYLDVTVTLLSLSPSCKCNCMCDHSGILWSTLLSVIQQKDRTSNYSNLCFFTPLTKMMPVYLPQSPVQSEITINNQKQLCIVKLVTVCGETDDSHHRLSVFKGVSMEQYGHGSSGQTFS